MIDTGNSQRSPQGFGEELVKREDEVSGVIQKISGFQAYYLLRTDQGGVVTISVFDDQAGPRNRPERRQNGSGATCPTWT